MCQLLLRLLQMLSQSTTPLKFFTTSFHLSNRQNKYSRSQQVTCLWGKSEYLYCASWCSWGGLWLRADFIFRHSDTTGGGIPVWWWRMCVHSFVCPQGSCRWAEWAQSPNLRKSPRLCCLVDVCDVTLLCGQCGKLVSRALKSRVHPHW